MLKTLFGYLHSLNNSRFFAGLVMIMLNVGSKYITIELSKSQEQYLRNTLALDKSKSREESLFEVYNNGRQIVEKILLKFYHQMKMHLKQEKCISH